MDGLDLLLLWMCLQPSPPPKPVDLRLTPRQARRAARAAQRCRDAHELATFGWIADPAERAMLVARFGPKVVR